MADHLHPPVEVASLSRGRGVVAHGGCDRLIRPAEVASTIDTKIPSWYAGAVQGTTHSSTEDRMVSLRWPEGVACVDCGNAEVVERPRRRLRMWRCVCGRDFTVTTGTALHSSKLGLSAWGAAARAVDDSPSGVSALLGVSAATARRMSRILRSVATAPGDRRVAALLAAPRRSHSSRTASPSGMARLASHRDPIAGSPESHRLILAALRARLNGATAALVAEDADVSVSHARRCLRLLRDEGFVRCEDTHIPWGYGRRKVRLWELKLTTRTLDALPRLPWRPASDRSCDGVPPEYWWLFWSGTSAADLRLPEDSLQIADAMIGGPSYRARAWALTCLPVEALQQLRTMRGYDSGSMADVLDSAVHERSCA